MSKQGIKGYLTLSCRENEELIAKLSVPPEGSKDLYFKSAYPQSQLTQTRLLLTEGPHHVLAQPQLQQRPLRVHRHPGPHCGRHLLGPRFPQVLTLPI